MNNQNQKIQGCVFSSKSVLPVAIMLAFLSGALLLGFSGYSPVAAYGALLRGSFGNVNSVAEVLLKTTPLLLAALGLTISNRANVISIGAEGQIFLGAMGAAAVGLFMGPLPAVLAIPLCMLAGVMGWFCRLVKSEDERKRNHCNPYDELHSNRDGAVSGKWSVAGSQFRGTLLGPDYPGSVDAGSGASYTSAHWPAYSACHGSGILVDSPPYNPGVPVHGMRLKSKGSRGKRNQWQTHDSSVYAN